VSVTAEVRADRPDAADAAEAGRRPVRKFTPLQIAVGVLLVAANVCTAANLHFPMLVPALGLFLLVVLPVALLVTKVDWHTDSPAERIGYSLATTLFLLMFAGLTVNAILPAIGIRGALTRIPVLVIGDAIVAALLLWRRGEVRWRPRRNLLEIRCSLKEKVVTRLAIVAPVLAVIGATRLNNGTDDAVSLVMLAVVFGTLALLFLWRHELDPGAISFVIYMLGLAMLLATSMRGWYTTGHDIQREYRVFELTKSNGNWSISRFVDAYNACLSVTILPMMLWVVTKVHDPYVFKVIFQALFALGPVLVYRLSLRFTGRTIAIIGITYLLCFPTFSNDMPFENRQEIAFLFVLAVLLVMTNPSMPLRQKRLWIAVFSLGMIVSHYSTAAVFIATVVVAVGANYLLKALRPRLGKWGRRLHLPRSNLRGDSYRPVIGLANTALMVGAAFMWIGVITGTGSTLASTIDSAATSIGQTFSFSAKSSDVAYNLFSLSQPSDTQLINEYRAQTISDIPKREGFFPVSLVDTSAPTPAVSRDATLTGLGRIIGKTGINVKGVDDFFHAGAAKLLQILVLVGLVAALVSRRARLRMAREPYLFAFGTLVVLVAEVVAPVVSENYGILRAFMQGLLILSPVLAFGSYMLLRRLGTRLAASLSMLLALCMFALLSGLIPQLLGGDQPSLALDNSGLYYNIYYPHTQEIAAIDWLQRHTSNRAETSVQAEVETDKFEFQRLRIYSGVDPVNDIFPTLLRRRSFVFLGYTTVTDGLAGISYKGNLVMYRYPKSFLLHWKDLLFNDGGAEVFR
jgi:uncharacterized membrane protein